jgi:trans-2,3-dihydro-3-hydroxyanthranilate isomerase
VTRRTRFVTVDVFTDVRFGGNPLAVFPDASGLSDREMQALAREFNLSETTFVLPPTDPRNTARVRIFDRTAEMPFAGHPNVGTGWVLAREGRAPDGRLRFEEIAGTVEIVVDALGATIQAPQPLSTGAGPPADGIATAAGLAGADLMTSAHPPMLASVGLPFVVVEVSADTLTRAAPQEAAFRRLRDAWRPGEDLALHLYARTGSGRLRARMFSPLSGTPEDPATGSANATLAAFLLSLTADEQLSCTIEQGAEMGRPSLLRATARRTPDGIRATIGGNCVEVLSGTATL